MSRAHVREPHPVAAQPAEGQAPPIRPNERLQSVAFPADIECNVAEIMLLYGRPGHPAPRLCSSSE